MPRKGTKKEIENDESIIDMDKIKEELTDHIDIQIKRYYSEEIEKANKKLLREKNKKILAKNIYILILLIIIILLSYLLFISGYFNKILNIKCPSCDNVKTYYNNTIQNQDLNETNTIEPEKTIEDLKKEYSYLLDKIVLNENCTYLDDFYNGKFTEEIKKYITINQMNFNNLESENDYSIINEDIFKETFSSLIDSEYKAGNFDYDNNNILYINKLSSYISTKKLNKNKSNIKREIIKIEENDKNIKITTIEGIVINNILYDTKNNQISNYKKDSLINYEDKLSKITYIFSNNLLSGIEKSK